MDQEKITAKLGRIPKSIKIILGMLILVLPVVIVMLIFGPIASKKIDKETLDKYKLEHPFSEDDLKSIVDAMRMEYEFQFYFLILDEEMVERAVHEAYLILSKSQDTGSLLVRLMQMQEKVHSLSVLFYHLDYSDNFFKDPQAFPELNRILWQLLEEEFTLTVLGVFYKANYVHDFSFQWGQTAHQAALKLKNIVMKLKDQGTIR